ncbi:TonB-dependent receptor [Ferrovibrio sp.]|uniref:TonB-dependent receptor n=1 Tax=Ferrovibrio sp. TaxID=1917215 RepID=UPI001B5191AB|nr:TonB-dependent receptor [Ferrovibrio sp.]MBP7064794.1 TonB-dependent receptor [Ferrovibrio sp.]
MTPSPRKLLAAPLLATPLLVALLAAPALAQTALPPVVVSAPLPTNTDDLVEGSTVLEGQRLERQRAATLGETLDNTPGLAATGFGPGASRPVIRGQGGPRVRVLQNGLDTFDASGLSPDHAVVAPMGSARRIEVLRGPATLLYGSSAIGGVVNVIDGRIPDAMPKDGLAGQARLQNSLGRSDHDAFAAVDTAIGPNIALHAEGGLLNAEDYRAATGRVDNSAMRSRNGALGAAWFGDAGHAGLAVSRFHSYYGVPGADPVHIAMRQTRLDGKFGIYDPLSNVSEIRGKFGYADYKHDEIEPSAEIGTRFNSDSWEGRLEALHTLGGLEGVLGVQSNRRDFTALGAEAFLPQNVTDNHALFALERYELGPWQFALGGRLEYQKIEVPAQAQQRDFTSGSLSASATYRFNNTYSTGLSLSRTERAPSAEELFSNGSHIATQSFEIGNAALGKEQAWHAEWSLRRNAGDVTGAFNLFATRYNDFIYGAFTGAQQAGLNELRYSQTDADFRGVEIEAAWRFMQLAGFNLSLDGGLDYVRAQDRGNGRPLPLIPPLGLRAGFNAEAQDVSLRVEMVSRLEQDRTGANETATSGYTLLNASASYRPFADTPGLLLQLKGRNLTDMAGRNHVSLLKNSAPIRGRELLLGLAVTF